MDKFIIDNKRSVLIIGNPSYVNENDAVTDFTVVKGEDLTNLYYPKLRNNDDIEDFK